MGNSWERAKWETGGVRRVSWGIEKTLGMMGLQGKEENQEKPEAERISRRLCSIMQMLQETQLRLTGNLK